MPPFLELPEFEFTKAEVEQKLRFLSSDELMGRRTGSVFNDIAAGYIATHFAAHGLKPAPGQADYFQPIAFDINTPPKTGKLIVDKKAFTQGGDLQLISGAAKNLKKGTAVFAGHGLEADYEGKDVKGKIVFVLPGIPDDKNPMTVFKNIPIKKKLAAEKGAAALIELYQISVPWKFFKNYFGKPGMRLSDKDATTDETANDMVYGWIYNLPKETIGKMQSGKKVKISLNNSASNAKVVYSNNVVGIIEGRDPELKDEYVVLSAHYDHVGTGKDGGGAFSEQDSIFNGARDNAIGTTAILCATKALSIQRPRRSVAIIAFTGEELGLLGSSYYAKNPLLPLNKTVFNLNTDGAGYNDTSYVSIIGYGRTGTDEAIKAGTSPFGLDIFPDPAPEQNLFDRSDNVSFAAKGVPAMCFSPGVTAFDEAVMKHYHQISDEADSIDFDYLLKFCKALTHTARIIADHDERPWWKKGDKYEEAGNELFNK